MEPYVSIDIETTGLDPSYCQILEFAAVIDDGRPIGQLPTFHRYVKHDRIQGEAFALNMNAELLMRCMHGVPVDQFAAGFPHFLASHGIDIENVVVAGKNFAAFDLQFLNRVRIGVQFHHRFLDPAMLYWRYGEMPPNTKTCLERAGLDSDVKHEALEDAFDVIRLIRAAFDQPTAKTKRLSVLEVYGGRKAA